MTHDFDDKLKFSTGVRQSTDLATIQAMIPGCVTVIKTDHNTDRKGIDYVATLRRGAEVLIDGKARKPGAKRFWRYGEPELALEVWSVRPGGKHKMPMSRTKTGWTLSEKSNVDMIYYSYDLADTNRVFLVPFQVLRIAFRLNFHAWKARYGAEPQYSSSRSGAEWESEAIFVPWSEVDGAMSAVEQNVSRDGHGNPLLFEDW